MWALLQFWGVSEVVGISGSSFLISIFSQYMRKPSHYLSTRVGRKCQKSEERGPVINAVWLLGSLEVSGLNLNGNPLAWLGIFSLASSVRQVLSSHHDGINQSWNFSRHETSYECKECEGEWKEVIIMMSYRI